MVPPPPDPPLPLDITNLTVNGPVTTETLPTGPLTPFTVAHESAPAVNLPAVVQSAIHAAFTAYRLAHPRTPADALLCPLSVDAVGAVYLHPVESIYGADGRPGMGPAGSSGTVVIPPTPDLTPAVAASPVAVSRVPSPLDGPSRGRLLPIVAFAGPRGSGKDAAALGCLSAGRPGAHPEDSTATPHRPLGPGWVTLALADDLKRRTAFVFGFPWQNLTGPSKAREEPLPVAADWRERWPVVFGPALFTPAWEDPSNTVPPPDPAALDAARADVWERIETYLATGPTPGLIPCRYVLQWIGTDYARRVRDDVWLHRLWAVYGELCRGAGYRRTAGLIDRGPCYWPPDAATPPRPAVFLPTPHDGPVCGAASPLPAGVIVTDARFPNEVRAIATDGPPWVAPGTWRHGAAWWIDAEGAPWCPPRMTHASEPEYDDLAPYVTGTIPNRPETGDLAAFTRRVLGHVHTFVDGLPR